MGAIYKMSSFVAAVMALCLLPAGVAFAADKQFNNPQEEIVYRTNLGRAADVRLLIKQGVSPDQQDASGVPVLALAAKRKDPEGMNVLKALVEAGADLNARDARGQTALFYAIRQDNTDAIDYLLNKGINYYATDTEGIIARTEAFNLGRKKLVERLDAFVLAQTEKVNREYQEYARQMEERNRQIEEENRKAQEEAAQKAAAEAKAQAEAEAVPAETTPKTEQDEYLAALTPADNRNTAQKRESEDFETDMRMLAFHNCAFQYWSFCRAVKQTSDLSVDEIRVAIDAHRQQVLEQSKHAAKEYALEQEYTDTVSKNAKQRISDILNDMPSSTYRFQRGVCKMPDLQTRCTEIAETWNIAPPVREEPATYPHHRRSTRGGR